VSTIRPQSLPNAKDVRAQAADWLQRSQFWAWSGEDQAALDAWLAQSASHMTAYLRVRAAWENTGRLTALRTARPAVQVFAARRRILPMLMGAAAVAVIAAVVGARLLPPLFVSPERTYATGVGGHEALKLSDGSQIELNTDTRLRIAVGTQERKVWLERGEVYFQIRHDAQRPFIVLAGNDRVTDLGTKFTVRRDDHRLQVAVMEGRVQLDAKVGSTPRSISLVQGDVVVSSGEALPLMKKPQAELAKELSWRSGVLIFENTTLAEAAAEFNRYNTAKVVVTGADAEHLIIGGKFATNDIAAFAELAQHVLGLRVEDHGGVTVISR
jgi:transmembrane sensor